MNLFLCRNGIKRSDSKWIYYTYAKWETSCCNIAGFLNLKIMAITFVTCGHLFPHSMRYSKQTKDVLERIKEKGD